MPIQHYFLGSISPGGFSGFFEQLLSNNAPCRLRILKSGPGCGKSSMMRRIAERLHNAGYPLELIHCASDPLSIDAVLCPAKNFAIVDGTFPHTLEPVIAGAVQEVVSLFDYMDNAKLQASAPALIPLFEKNSALVARAKRFVAAAGSLHFDIERTARSLLIAEKAERYARNLAAKNLPKKKDAPPGTETLRFASAITPLGIVDHNWSNLEHCPSVHLFEDRFGPAAQRMLETVRSAALQSGYDIVTCRSFLSPYDTIDAIYVPELNTAFAHSSYLSPLKIDGAHCVQDRRFYNTDALSQCQKRLAFSKKAVLELLNEAAMLLAEAKTVHDEIERYYVDAVDFEAIHVCEHRIIRALGLSFDPEDYPDLGAR